MLTDRRAQMFLLLFALPLLVPASQQQQQQQQQQPQQLQQPRRGIVVPKRSALIVGLNQQFKQRPATLNPSSQAQQEPSAPILAGWLGQRGSGPRRPHSETGSPTLTTRSEPLAAAQPGQSETGQQTASNGQQQPNGTSTSGQQLAPPAQLQQLYRGYSLIELEVKSEHDRRYVQDLYGNLSAALNEQARNPNSLTVSPYADVDFWSFKYALNDQIDIMVSPKSRAFILGQLNRAKIRHRVKIDDIQSRLDAQQQQQLPVGATSAFAQPSPAGLSGRAGEPSDSAAARRADPVGEPAGRQALNESLFFESYQRLADINQFIEALVERNRDVAQVKVIGRSTQNRYLRVVRLGYEPREEEAGAADESEGGLAKRPAPGNASQVLEHFFRRQESVRKLGAIWLDGGTHAREWISPATVLYILHRLTDNHQRCRRFFDVMRLMVDQQQSSPARGARRYGPPTPAQVPAPGALDAELLSGINEINSSLLGRPVPLQQTRPRNQLEKTLELLAKSPQEVASEHGCELDTEQLLRRYTFYVMPVLNPDGYEYSHTHNRLWRKTRSTSSHPIYRHFCLGADPNRNYDARHGTAGSSSHPCSQTYAGSVPFTEPETWHQSNFVYANRADMKMYISFHSYSQMILMPLSHSKQLIPDHKDLESVGQAAVRAIERTHGTQYRVGPSAAILYTASGTASDWAYEKAGIKYSYTIELRDTGAHGFLLPRQQILPTGEETFNGLLAMVAQMEKNDNLLTSKSGQQSLDSADKPTENGPVGTSQLNSLVREPARVALENVFDWADSESGSSGVRDRRPGAPIAADDNSLKDNHSANFDADEDDSDRYAFEGEGILLEPNLIRTAAELEATAKLSARQDLSQLRIAQSAPGRNLINSPPSAKRSVSKIVPKRELSSTLIGDF